MITYGFIKKLNEDDSINSVNKIILGTFGIIIGMIMDFLVILSLPFIFIATFIYYVINQLERE